MKANRGLSLEIVLDVFSDGNVLCHRKEGALTLQDLELLMTEL